MPKGGPRPNSGGKRPGAGRKKGANTRKTGKTNAIAAQAAGEGVLPLTVLLVLMRKAYAAGNDAEAAKLAIAAAPYKHPKLAPLPYAGDDLKNLTDEQLDQRLAELEGRVRPPARGNGAPPAAADGALPD